MTIADAPATPASGLPTRLALPAPSPDLPPVLDPLLDALDAAGWVREWTSAYGPVDRSGLSDETDGDGHRKRVTRTEVVASTCVRARHVDGRALVALFVQPAGLTPTGRQPAYSLEFARRAPVLGVRCSCPRVDETGHPTRPHIGEHAPVELGADEVLAFAAAGSAQHGHAAVEQLRAEAAAAKQARADSKVPCPRCRALVAPTSKGVLRKHKAAGAHCDGSGAPVELGQVAA